MTPTSTGSTSTKPVEPASPGLLARIQSWVRRKDASFFFYFGGRLSSGVFDIFTIKYVVAFLSREQYGEWGFLTIVSGVLIPIATLSLPQAMMRMYFDQGAEGTGRRDLVSSVGLTTLGGMLLVSLGGLAAWLLGAAQGLTALFLVTVVSARIAVTYFNYLTVTRNDYGLFFFNRLVESGVYLAVVAAAVHFSGASSTALLGGGDRLTWLTWCLATTLWTVALVSATYYSKRGLVSLKAKLYGAEQYRALLAYSLPLIPTFFLGWVLSASDVWLLRKLSTLSETADYVFAARIVTVVGLVQQAALTDWPRFYYAQMSSKNEDRDAKIARRVQLFLLLHAATILVVRLIEHYAYDLLGAEAFTAGLEYLGYLLLGNFFFLAGNLFAAGLGYAKRTRLVLLTFLVPAILNFVVNLWAVPTFGARGAALTTLGAYAVFALVALLLGRPFYRFQGLGFVGAITVIASALALL